MKKKSHELGVDVDEIIKKEFDQIQPGNFKATDFRNLFLKNFFN